MNILTDLKSYDADGNLTEDWSWGYTWNAENRLVMIQTKLAAATSGFPFQRITYAYDSQGRRFQRQVFDWDMQANDWTTNPTQVTLYLYDDWNLIYEADLSDPANPQSAHVNAKSYAWGLDLSGTMQGAGGVGGLLAVANDSGNTYYPVYDHIGNVRAYVDGVTADVVAEFEYSPFGETLQASGSKVNEFAFRFSTKHQDASSGLYYYGYRWYDSELGRWLNRDPIEESGGLNLYAFVSNQTSDTYDYLGLSTPIISFVHECAKGIIEGRVTSKLRRLVRAADLSKNHLAIDCAFRGSNRFRNRHVDLPEYFKDIENDDSIIRDIVSCVTGKLIGRRVDRFADDAVPDQIKR